MRYFTTIGEQVFSVEILDDETLLINGSRVQVDFVEIGAGRVYSLLIEGRSLEAYVHPTDDGWQVLLGGRHYRARVEDERAHRLNPDSTAGRHDHGEYALKAPMPGLVVAVVVADGQEVERGDVLVILESMKMQNELKAPRSGRVARVRISAGDRVEQHDTLLTLI